jgi:aldehyde dehydrogenase (NAD+)
MRPGPTWADDTTLAPIVSAAQAERMESLLAASVEGGARIVEGGAWMKTDLGGIFFAPTIVTHASPDSPAVRDELFGPILTVQPFDDFDEGLALADHAVYGLAGAVHTRDIGKALRAARSIQAGTVWVNCFGPNTDPNAPMGGYKQSGFGKDFGVLGMDKFLKVKNIQVRV